VDPVWGGVLGLVEVGVQAADLVDGERDQLAGFVTVHGLSVMVRLFRAPCMAGPS
jgi:hypothetical protein